MTKEQMLEYAKPILFNTDMVQAILNNKKTATRRKIDIDISNSFDVDHDRKTVVACIDQETGDSYSPEKMCRYRIGDILYVRETWNFVYNMDDNDQIIENTGRYIYYADDPMPFSHWVDPDTGEHKNKMPWRPSIYMPKAAARIFLKVKDVRVERLQDIDSLGAYNEGANAEIPPILNGLKFPDDFENWSEDKKDKWFENAGRHTYMAKLELANRLIFSFKKIWNATISTKDLNKYSWEVNPWVWVIEFERVVPE